VVLAIGAWAAAVALAPNAIVAGAMVLPVAAAAAAYWILAKPSRWVTAYLAAALLLPPLPIALGDSGPHLALAVAALGVLCGLVRLREWRLPADPFLSTAFCGLTAVLLASVGAAALYSGPAIAAASLARVGLFAIGVYVYFYTASEGIQRPFAAELAIYWCSVAAALFACVDFYYQLPAPAGYGPQFVWLDSGMFRRAQGLFYEASTLGNFCAFFLVMIATALVRRPPALLSRTGLVAGGAVFLTALILSFSRGSLVNVGVACTVLLVRERRRVAIGTAVRIGLICAAGLTLMLGIFPRFAETYWLRITVSVQYFFSATEGVLSGRVASWRSLLELVRTNPVHLLVGVGYKTLPYTYSFGAPVIADNMYLSMLVETGMAGLAAVAGLSAAILRGSGRAARHHDARTAFLGTWMFCFWAGEMVQMLSGDLLTYWRVLGLYFWVLALAVASAGRLESQ
jgi:hypothetical protein